MKNCMQENFLSVLITLHPTHLMVDEFKMSITENS